MVRNEALKVLNCGVGQESWVSLGLQGDPPHHAKGNQSWILIGRTDAEAETPIFGQLIWRTYSSEKTLLLGKIEGRRRRGWQRMRWLDGIVNSMTWIWARSRSWWWTEKPGVLQSMGLQRFSHYWVTELNWTYNIANTISNGHVSPARLALPNASTHIFYQDCTHAQKSVPSIHKAFSEFWLQGDLHFNLHKGVKDTFIFLSQITPK